MNFTKKILNYLTDRQLNYSLNFNHYEDKIIQSFYENSDFLYSSTIDLPDNKIISLLEFSKNGNLMATGSKKEIIILNLDGTFPFSSNYLELKQNKVINTLDFNIDSSKIYSGSSSSLIINNTSTGEIINNLFVNDCVNNISSCPKNLDLTTFSTDNNIYLHDSRNYKLQIVNKENYESKLKTLHYHPLDENLLLLAFENNICVLDLRNYKTVYDYNLFYTYNYQVVDAKYNSKGTQILVSRKNLCPTLFHSNEKYPICEFDNFGYNSYNYDGKCCFAGLNDEYVISASRNYNIYIWETPKRSNNTFYESNKIVKKVKNANLILKKHCTEIKNVKFNCKKSILASFDYDDQLIFWSPFKFFSKSKLIKDLNNIDQDRNLNTKQKKNFKAYIKENLVNFLKNSDAKIFNSTDISLKNMKNLLTTRSWNFTNEAFNENINISIINSIIKNYKAKEKNEYLYLSQCIDDTLKQKFNLKSQLQQLNILFEIKKVFVAKNLILISVCYLKFQLYKIQNQSIQINNNNLIQVDLESLRRLEQKKYFIKKMIDDLWMIIKQNSYIYEKSREYMFLMIKK